jgi:hypothetical protein
MFKKIGDYWRSLRGNDELMRLAADAMAWEWQQRSLSEIQSMLDKPAGACHFERVFEDRPLQFTIQEWGTGHPGFSANVSGLKTAFGVKPGNHFYKSTDYPVAPHADTSICGKEASKMIR